MKRRRYHPGENITKAGPHLVQCISAWSSPAPHLTGGVGQWISLDQEIVDALSAANGASYSSRCIGLRPMLKIL